MNRGHDTDSGQKLRREGTPSPPSVKTRAMVRKQPFSGHGVPTLPGFVCGEDLKRYMNHLTSLLLSGLCLLFLYGCTSNPTFPRPEKALTSVTIVCCDRPDTVTLLAETKTRLLTQFAVLFAPLARTPIAAGAIVGIAASSNQALETSFPSKGKTNLKYKLSIQKR